MAQLFRICKPEFCCAIRGYGTQRYQQNHYETLNVSSDASQKEIRNAFIKLSKQLHPDTSGKHSHADFVKLNEAYSILGKESTRRQYDFNLKCYKCNPYYTHNTRKTQYESRWEYEIRTAGGPWPPPNQKPNEYFGLMIALFFLGLGLIPTFFMFHSMRVREIVRLRSVQFEREYQQIRDRAHLRNSNESNNRLIIENLNSLKDLDEYVAGENSK